MSARVMEGYEPLDYFKKKHGPEILEFTDDGVNCIIGLNMTEERLAEIIKEREEKGITTELNIVDENVLEMIRVADELTTSIYISNEEKRQLTEKGVDYNKVINGEISVAQMERILKGEDVNIVLAPPAKEEGVKATTTEEPVKVEEPVKKVKKLFKKRTTPVEEPTVAVEKEVPSVNEEVKVETDIKVIQEEKQLSPAEQMRLNSLQMLNNMCREEEEGTDILTIEEEDKEEYEDVTSYSDDIAKFGSMSDAFANMSDSEFLKNNTIDEEEYQEDYENDMPENGVSIGDFFAEYNEEEATEDLKKMLKESGDDFDFENGDYDSWNPNMGILDEYEDEEEDEDDDEEEEEDKGPEYTVIYFGAESKKELTSWEKLMVKTYPDRYKMGKDPRAKIEKANRKRAEKIKRKKEALKNMTPEEKEAYEYEKEMKAYAKQYNKFRKNIIFKEDKKAYKKFVKKQEKINNSYNKYMRDMNKEKDIKDVIELTRHREIQSMHKRIGWKKFFKKKKYWQHDDPFKRYRSDSNIITVSEAARYKKDFCNTFLKNLEMGVLEKLNSPINMDGETIVEYYDKHGRLKSKEVVKREKTKEEKKAKKKRKKKIEKHEKKIQKKFKEYKPW